MRTIFLGLLGHQTNVGDMASSSVIKLTMGLAVFYDGLIDGSVASVRDQALNLLELIVLVPHLASISDDIGHRSVDDHIGGDMEIGYSFSGVNHGKTGSGVISSLEGGFDFSLFRMSLDLFIQVAKSVVYVHFQST